MCFFYVMKMIITVIIWYSVAVMSGVSSADPALTPWPIASVTGSDTVTLTCAYTSSSAPKSVVWKKDGSLFVTAWLSGCSRFQSPPSGYTDSCVQFANKYTYTMTTPVLTQADHGQTWQCEVVASARLNSGVTTVLVKGMSGTFLFLTPGPIVIVPENTPLTLTCVYTSSSAPNSVSWRKDGSLFVTAWMSGCNRFQSPSTEYTDSCKRSPNNYTYTLTTPALTRANHGQTWQCVTASPNRESSVITVSVTASVPISNVTLSPPGSYMIADRVKEFVCETDAGFPQASIRWYRNTLTSKNDEEITGDAPTTSTNSAGLIITRGTLQYTPTRAMLGGRIFCTASNTAGNTKTSRKPTFDVQYPPSINVIPDQDVIEGSSVSVTCTATPGNPSTTTYSWTRSTSSSWSQSGAALTISSVQISDAATYTCTATNIMVGGVAGNDTEDFILNVLFPPTVPTFSVSGTPVSGTVKEVRGKDLPVTCTSSSNPAPTYTWTGPQLGAGHQGQVLTLTGIQTAMDGKYTCKVTNTMTPTSGGTVPGSNQASITIETLSPPSKPTFLYNDAADSPISTDTPLSVVENDDFRVACVTTGNPSPGYRWTPQGTSDRILAITNIGRNVNTARCTATNTLSPTVGTSTPGTSYTDLSINVMYGPSKPTIRYSSGGSAVSTPLRVILGQSVRVLCNGSTSNPGSTYSWSGLHTSSDGSLTIQTITKQDAGSYTCTATNTMDRTFGDTATSTNTNVMTLDVLYPPSKPTFLYNDAAGSPISTGTPLSVVENDDFRVACVSSGNPSPGYQWTPQGTSDRILTITNIGRDVNTARCTVTNILSPTVGSSTPGTSYTDLSINVMYGPSKPTMRYSSSGSVVSSPLRVILGRSISVSCSGSTSNPGSTYSWSGSKSSSDGSLTIQNIAKQDAGNYTCTATNAMVRTFGPTAAGTSSDVMSVDVVFAPVVGVVPDKVIEENQGLSITCPVTPGNPATTSFRWTRDKDSSWSRTGQTLTLAPSRDDADRYTCTASNVMQPSQGDAVATTDSKSFNVKVHFKSSITTFEIKDHPGTNITISETDALSFECSATSNPASTITVMKDTNVVAQSDNTQKVEYPIDNATCEDSGTYTCTAYNQYNGDEHATTRAIQLNVRCKPRPKYSTSNNITVYKALYDPLTLNLTIVAYPQPNTYTWSKLTGNNWTTTSGSINIISEAVDSTPNITFMSTLNINSIGLADFGQYRLEIQNGIDNGSVQYFTVIAQGKPQTPTELEIIQETITQSAATVRWKPMSNGGLKQTFHLQYRSSSDENWKEKTVLEEALAVVNGTVNLTLTQLSADTKYTVRLFSRNIKGDSNSTAPVEFSTREGASTTSTSSIVVIAATSAGVGLLVLILVVVAVVIMRRRRGNSKSTLDMRLNHRGDHPAGGKALEQDRVYVNIAETRSEMYRNSQI